MEDLLAPEDPALEYVATKSNPLWLKLCNYIDAGSITQSAKLMEGPAWVQKMMIDP